MPSVATVPTVDLGQPALGGRDAQPLQPVLAQRPQRLDVGEGEGQPAVPARDEVVDPHLADGQVQCAHRVQLGAAEVDLRDAARRVTASSAAPPSGNTLVTAIGLRSATASTTLRPSSVSNCSDSTTPCRASAVVSRLPTSMQQLAQRDPRDDVEHHAATADGEIAGREIGPVAQLLGRGVHGRLVCAEIV